MDALNLILSDSRGIYIPRDFVTEFDLTKFSGIDPEDVEICKDPDHEWYWEAWSAILSDAEYHADGNTWILHQDGDLWLVCSALMTPTEYDEFFGEPMDSDLVEEYARKHDLLAFELPSHWASAMVNGDDSGLEESEIAEIETFESREDPGWCVDVIGEFFSRSNDANNLGGDVSVFLFQKAP